MKLLSKLIATLMVTSIAVTPMQAAPKAKSDDEKRAEAAAKAREGAAKAAPQAAVQRPVAKAPSQPKPVARPSPQRPPSVKQSAPQRAVSKAPDRPKPVAQPTPQRPPEVKRSAPQREVAKAPSQPRPAMNKAPNREPVARTAPPEKKTPSVEQPRRVSPPERSPERAIAERPAPQNIPNARAQGRTRDNVRENIEDNSVKKAREAATGRDLVRSPEIRSPRADRETPMTAAGARAAATAERDRAERGNRPDRVPVNPAITRDVDRQLDRNLGRVPVDRGDANQLNRRPKDLTMPRDGSGRPDTVQDTRIRDRGDRRPAPLNTAEERQLREARAEIRDRAAKERRRQISQRLERSRDRVEGFRENRQNRFAAVQNVRQDLRTNVISQTNTQVVIENRNIVRNYWSDRGEDVRYRVGYHRDYLFNDDWWDRCHWRNHHVRVSNPWWWWQPARWSTVSVFLDAGWNEPVLYDYGADVIYDDRAVYVRGEPVGTPLEYSRQVIQLANPAVDVIAEAPVDEAAWTPLGVWALVQENQGDAVMFFQLSVNKEGLISGAYSNVVSGESLPVAGQVDRKNQRAAWHIGDQTEKVFEAGMSNLTEDQASCLVHVAPGEMQPWLLVRMEGPELPNRPASVSPAPSASAD